MKTPIPHTYQITARTLDPGDLFHSPSTGWRRAVRVRSFSEGVEVLHGLHHGHAGQLAYALYQHGERVSVPVMGNSAEGVA